MPRSRKPAPAADNGCRILSARTFGEFSRYRLEEFLGRDGAVTWIVKDAERIDPVVDLPAIIRQEATAAAALDGLVRRGLVAEAEAARVLAAVAARRSK